MKTAMFINDGGSPLPWVHYLNCYYHVLGLFFKLIYFGCFLLSGSLPVRLCESERSTEVRLRPRPQRVGWRWEVRPRQDPPRWRRRSLLTRHRRPLLQRESTHASRFRSSESFHKSKLKNLLRLSCILIHYGLKLYLVQFWYERPSCVSIEP